MSYQVIARKYRPQLFKDVVGQDHVTVTLTHAIQQNRIAHAYLFCGPRGTGKTTIARIFAKCLNATGGPRVDFDDNDLRAREIAEGRSLDVLEIDGASNNGVEQVRELRETCKYAPASSKFKIYIIDEVHMLSTAAFNALLKTLEEPPDHVKFMFATTEPERVLPTILSRCQRFDLRRIPSALIVKHLAHIASLEKVQIEETALYAIARGAEGGMRDAESTLDQLISFCSGKIAEQDVLSMFGLTAHAQLQELSRSILNNEIEPALRQLDDLARHGKDFGRLLADLLNHFRNLLLFQVSRGDTGLLEVSESEAVSLKDQSSMADVPALTRILEVLTDAESRLRDAVSRRILVEVTLLKAIEARNAVSIDAVLSKLESLRPGQAPEPPGSGIPAAGTKQPRSAPATPEPKHPARTTRLNNITTAPSQTTTGENGLETLWAQLVDAVGRASPFTRSYLLEAHPVDFDNNLFKIGFDPEFAEHIGLVDNARNHTLLQTKLAELGHPNVQFKFIKADAPSRARQPALAVPAPSAPAPIATAPPPTPETAVRVKPAPAPFNKDDFKNDPLIKKALEIFKGQIVDVRA